VFTLALSLAAFFYVRQEYHDNNVPNNDFYACDFHMRMNEIECVKQGINPYDVWNLAREVMPYVPNRHHELWTPERCEFINAYSPWEYIMLMPVSCIPRKVAWRIYNFGQLLALLLIAGISYWRGKRIVDNGPLAAAFSLFVAFSAMNDFGSGNFCLFITLAILLMALALNKGHDLIAGLFWVVVMLKPQIGLLFAVPLLMRRKWVTCFVAGGVCLALTIVAAWMCHTPVVAILRQAAQGSSFWFHGCGILPYDIFLSLSKAFSSDVLITVASLSGFVFCAIMTQRLKRFDDWLVLLIPSTICAVTCNYNNGYNFCVCSLILMSIAICLHYAKSAFSIILLLLLTCFASRAYDCFAYVINMANGVLCRSGLWTWGPISQETQWVISSWNATFLLALTVWFVRFIRRNVAEGEALK